MYAIIVRDHVHEGRLFGEVAGRRVSEVRLGEFAELAIYYRERLGVQFQGFRTDDKVLPLKWPADVVEQFLYDHADNDHFLRDYGDVDLSAVTWDVEIIAVED